MSVEYKNTGSFRMWCRINIPNYSEADDYKDLLIKAIAFLSEQISRTAYLQTAVQNLETVYATITGYSQHYPTETTYINQVNNELDIWSSAGTFNQLLENSTQYIINQGGTSNVT